MVLIKEAKRFQKLAGIITEADETQEASPEQPEAAPTPDIPSGPISQEEAKKLIRDTKGKFFTVTFIKRTTGETRVMNARLGVKAYLKGGELPYDPNEKNLIPVYDVKTGGYRMISGDSIIHLKIGTNEYDVK